MTPHPVRSGAVLALLAVVVLFPAGVSRAAAVEEASLSAVLREGDGGQHRERHLNRLRDHMVAAGCPAGLHAIAAEAPTPPGTALLFSPQPVDGAAPGLDGFRLLSRARTVDGELRMGGALLARALRKIGDPANLAGLRVALVSPHSPSGYRLPLERLARSGVVPSPAEAVIADSHIAAMALLMHNEVAAAAVATPLARQWAADGELVILAETPLVETGGWWIREDLAAQWAEPCHAALKTLSGRLLKPFPAWVGRFD